MMQNTKKRDRKSVATLQQTVEPTTPAECIAIDLMEYTKQTDVPILAEYCAKNELYEDFLLNLASKSKKLSISVKILQNKKRAALERKIYTAELNATIGVHLLKQWSEPVIPELPRLRVATMDELFELKLSSEEIKIYSDVSRELMRSDKPVEI